MAADQGLATPERSTPAGPGSGRRGAVSAFFAPKGRTRLGLLLGPPLLWLVIAYLGSIGVLLVSSMWSIDPFTTNLVHSYGFENLKAVYTQDIYRTVAWRSIRVAVVVTVIDVIVAFPIAFYMGVIARPAVRRIMVVAVLTPLWANYLVKAYSWRVMLTPTGPLSWATGGHTLSYGTTATTVTLAYLWLPYMIIPMYAGFERLPRSLFEASADLGAGTGRTIRSIVLPTVFPAVAAGSIFTFSLSLGDYIAVQLVGGKTQLLANLIYEQDVTANNQPLAAALTTIPLLAIVLYLLAMRRTGALENV